MTTKPNPLLEKIRMPGMTFSLPSKALFYHNQEVELEGGKPEVYVSPMTTMDELAITSVDKLLNGTAVDEVFARCIPSIKSPREILARDVDYLMMALRVVSFGASTTIDYQHSCDGARSCKYDIDVETSLIDKSVSLTPASLDKYEGDLSNGNHIILHPMTYGSLLSVQDTLDEIRKATTLQARAETRSEKSAAADAVSAASFSYYKAMACAVIESIDGIDDQDNIREWVSLLPIPQRREMLELFDKVEMWGPPTTIELLCKDCEEVVNVPLDLNPVSFFT